MQLKENVADRFPHFSFARPARVFLNYCASEEIRSQLARRKIIRVEKKELLTQGGLGVEENGFFVHLNDLCDITEHALTLGHEIAHTFHYNITLTPPGSILPPGKEVEVEEFCKYFAEQWVEINTLPKIEAWLKANVHK